MKKELHQNLESCLNGMMSFRNLETWLASVMQDILDSGDNEIIGIADSLDASLIEFGEKTITESDIRALLENLLNQLETVTFNTPRKEVTDAVEATTASETIRMDMNLSPVATHHWKLEFA